MRRRLPWVAYVFLCVPVAGMTAVAACGGGEDNPTDGGSDATTDVQPDIAKLPETGPDVLDAGCANDVDLTQYLPSADASIDVDAGGLDIAVCTGCLKDNCGTDINACNSDCDCRQGVIDLVTCIGGGGDLQGCFLDAVTSSDKNLTNLVACAYGQCLNICVPNGDGGTDAATDAPSDASDDGG